MIRAGTRALARQFIAGEDDHEASKALESLWERGCAGSVDLLGEEVLSDREAAEYQEKYLRLLDFLGPHARTWNEDLLLEKDHMGPIPRFDISLKVTSLYSQLDPIDWLRSVEKAKENLMPIIKRADEKGASVCFDMEQYYTKDLVLEIFRQTLGDAGDYHFGGIALQAYLGETARDLQDLIGWAKERKRPIRIRLVKGAYWDYEVVVNRQKGWRVPVFLNKAETDRNFEELTRLLLENADTVRPSIASHNIRSISNAIATAEQLGLPKHAFEFQMLFGMGEPLRKALREMGYRVRVYAPAGELIPGMAYLVRRLLENTSNVSFLREFFAEGKPFTEIIKPPEVIPEAPAENRPRGFTNEPARDFSKAGQREKMRQALAAVKKGFGGKYPLLIGGEEVYTEREIVSVDPAAPPECCRQGLFRRSRRSGQGDRGSAERLGCLEKHASCGKGGLPG